jgi:hypothetical protein
MTVRLAFGDVERMAERADQLGQLDAGDRNRCDVALITRHGRFLCSEVLSFYLKHHHLPA